MSAVARLLRRVAATRSATPVLEWYPVRRVIATVLRSAVVRSRARFVAAELTGRPGVASYRLRGSGRRIFVRHGSADVVTLDEVFLRRDYAIPAEVERRLRALARPAAVLDLGANIGLFGVFFLERFPDARLVAIEADERNVAVLRSCADANGGEEQWQIVAAAAATSDGTVRFVEDEFSLSRIGDEGEPTSAVDAFRFLGAADVAKIDIEGAEWALLADPRFREGSARLLVIEYHPYLAPEADARGAATRALTAAGFDVLPVHHFEHGHGVLWAIRPDG